MNQSGNYKTLRNIRVNHNFLDMIPKHEQQKKKNKLYFVKIKNFCASKDSQENEKTTTK